MCLKETSEKTVSLFSLVPRGCLHSLACGPGPSSYHLDLSFHDHFSFLDSESLVSLL